jgi:hypothetical protein
VRAVPIIFRQISPLITPFSFDIFALMSAILRTSAEPRRCRAAAAARARAERVYAAAAMPMPRRFSFSYAVIDIFTFISMMLPPPFSFL